MAIYARTLVERGHVQDVECRLLRKDWSALDCLASARLYPDLG